MAACFDFFVVSAFMFPLKAANFLFCYVAVNTGASSTAELIMIQSFLWFALAIFLSSLDCIALVRGLFA